MDAKVKYAEAERLYEHFSHVAVVPNYSIIPNPSPTMRPDQVLAINQARSMHNLRMNEHRQAAFEARKYKALMEAYRPLAFPEETKLPEETKPVSPVPEKGPEKVKVLAIRKPLKQQVA